MKSFVLFVLLPVFSLGGYFGYQQWQKELANDEVQQVAYACLHVIDRQVGQQSLATPEGFNQFKQALPLQIAEFERVNTDLATAEGRSALASCRLAATGYINKLQQMRTVLDEISSARFVDKGTWKHKAELEWRLKSLDAYTQMASEFSKMDAVIKESLYQGVTNSSASELIKRSYFAAVGSIYYEAYRRFYSSIGYSNKKISEQLKVFLQFMYKQRDNYEINDKGEVVFSRMESLLEFERLQREVVQSTNYLVQLEKEYEAKYKKIISNKSGG